MKQTLPLVVLSFILLPFISRGQELTDFPTKLFDRISRKTADLNQQLTNQTEKYLHKLARQEAKLQRRLSKTDSAGAAKLFSDDPIARYAQLEQKLKTDTVGTVHSMGPEYLPNVDSLQTALSFLSKNPQLVNSPAAIQRAQGQLTEVQLKLQDADVIKQYIQSRRTQIQQYLGQAANIPSGLTGALQEYKQQGYYYAQQVRQYREMLNDPDKMEQAALALLSKLPTFSGYMRNNSFLSGLFTIPGNYGSNQALVGLQTREQVLSMIQNQAGQSGGSGASRIQQSLQTAGQDLGNLQNKLNALGGGSGDMDMPDFKPNAQKTKTFLKRLEYGVNIQTTRASYYFPTYTDIGLSLGYKLNNSNIIGVGASYKIGWGSGYQDVAISSQGASLRSFVSIKIKKSFSLAGGYELNYLQPFTVYQTLDNLSNWTQSGLIGIAKTVSIKSAVFKKTQVQLLWDFLSYQQVPRTQPIIFRIGYTF